MDADLRALERQAKARPDDAAIARQLWVARLRAGDYSGVVAWLRGRIALSGRVFLNDPPLEEDPRHLPRVAKALWKCLWGRDGLNSHRGVRWGFTLADQRTAIYNRRGALAAGWRVYVLAVAWQGEVAIGIARAPGVGRHIEHDMPPTPACAWEELRASKAVGWTWDRRGYPSRPQLDRLREFVGRAGLPAWNDRIKLSTPHAHRLLQTLSPDLFGSLGHALTPSHPSSSEALPGS